MKLHSERVHFQSSLWRAFVVLILVIFNSEVNPDVLNVACKLICDNVPQQFSLILVKQPQFNRYRSTSSPLVSSVVFRRPLSQWLSRMIAQGGSTKAAYEFMMAELEKK